MSDSSPTMRPKELGGLLGVTSRTVRRWTSIGRLPAAETTLVGQHRYRPADVARAYENAGRAMPARLAEYIQRHSTPEVVEAVAVVELYPADEGDELGLITEARAELRRMARDGRTEAELQFCSGAVRIRRAGFEATSRAGAS